MISEKKSGEVRKAKGEKQFITTAPFADHYKQKWLSQEDVL
jgi:hypothetical protein